MFTEENPPKQSDYVSALNSIRKELNDRSLKVLQLQFQSPGRSVSSQDIRDAFNYDGIGLSNKLYGTLGRQLAEALPMQTEPVGASRTQYWSALSKRDGSGEHIMWIMRPELANALVQVGLVDPSTDGVVNVPDVDIHSESVTAVEGRAKLVSHLVRERNRALIEAKKASVENLACEICGFDSTVTYGESYCEVHHLIPLAQLQDDTETSIDDLAIVCANCHRIIHRHTPALDLEILRQRVQELRGAC